MAGFVGEIPGMYYDREKNKYFAIQASSSAPATSAYSSQDVKRRKLRDEKEAEAARKKERQKCRIQPSQLLQNPLIGGSLSRESGHDGFDPARIFAGGLVPRGYFGIEYQAVKEVGMFDISHKPDFGPSIIEVRHAIFALIKTLRLDISQHDYLSEDRNLDIVQSCNDIILARPRSSDMTSICVHEESQLLATTWLDGRPGSGIMFSEATFNGTDSGDVALMHRQHRHVILGPGYIRGSDVAIFSSTPASPSSNLLFAFGTSAGVLGTDKYGQFNTTYITPNPSKDQPDDTFAVEFLSENPSVLLSGGRRGILTVTDLRVPMSTSESGPDTITHPSSITHIRQLDQHRLLVSGLNSTLCQYDLRFRKLTDRTTHPVSKSKSRNTPKPRLNNNPTTPILVYPEYHNTSSHQASLDIDLSAGIIAAAQEADEFHPSVQLFSLHGGQTLASPHANGFQAKGDSDWLVKCLRFSRDSDLGTKSLYVGHRNVIQRYAWGEDSG